jgi:predicted O-methyltransferase YrrM
MPSAPNRPNPAPRDLPEELTQRLRAFQESRVILSAIEMDLFTAVGAGATVAEISARVKASERGIGALLDSLVAIDLLEKESPGGGEARYRNGHTAAEFLAEGGVNDLRLSLHHLLNMWTRWSMLTPSVRAGTSVPPPPELQGSPLDRTTTFIAAMDRGARMRAAEVVDAVGAAGISRMLDLGGGSAGYSIAFARANPSLRAVVLDLPDVVPLAKRYVAEAGLDDRVSARPGDMRTDDLGKGFDLVLLSQICHMFDREENDALIRRCAAALSLGGRLVIQDFILEPDRTRPRMSALFALNMLVATRGGSTYTAGEYESWMRASGFAEIRQVPLKGSGLVIGRKG